MNYPNNHIETQYAKTEEVQKVEEIIEETAEAADKPEPTNIEESKVEEIVEVSYKNIKI